MSRVTTALVGLATVLALCTACTVDPEKSPVPIEGSMYRLGKETYGERDEVRLKVFRTREDCRAALDEKDVEDCVPQVDRSNAQVRLAFQVVDKTSADVIRMPLEGDQLVVKQQGAVQQSFEMIPHNPVRVPQLFILLIDGSSSMNEVDADGKKRIDKLYSALMRKSVIGSFYPGDVKTGVTILRFSKTVQHIDGRDAESAQVLERPKLYKSMVNSHLMRLPGGFTHLYDAVGYTVKEFLQTPQIDEWISLNAAEPTVVALTDGFNNQRGDDTCATNVKRLESTLETINSAQNLPVGQRPTLYTIGLGKKIRKKYKLPENSMRVSRRDLCGKYANRTINNDLERDGIDNVSLEWMARVGRGESYTRTTSKGLAGVFEDAAAMRYEWFEVFYRAPSTVYHRQSFETELQLAAFANGRASISFYPSSWMDAPSGIIEPGERWSTPRPFRHTLVVMMPLLALLIFVSFWAPASFNARRAVFRRSVRSKSSPAHPSAPPLSPGEEQPPPPAA